MVQSLNRTARFAHENENEILDFFLFLFFTGNFQLRNKVSVFLKVSAAKFPSRFYKRKGKVPTSEN